MRREKSQLTQILLKALKKEYGSLQWEDFGALKRVEDAIERDYVAGRIQEAKRDLGDVIEKAIQYKREKINAKSRERFALDKLDRISAMLPTSATESRDWMDVNKIRAILEEEYRIEER